MRQLALAAAVLSIAVAGAHGQDIMRCNISSGPQTSVTLPSGQRNVFMGGRPRVRVRCPERDLTLIADSLESYGDEGRAVLLGRVEYREPRMELDSDFLTWYQRDERVLATGNVFVRHPNGSSLRGPTAEYYRVIPGRRLATRVVATGRPTINLVQQDSTTGSADTLVIDSDRVTMLGDSLVYAGGNVVATNPQVEARGDSMMVDSEAELLVMMRNPSITGLGDRPFTLTGTRIELTSENRELRRVLSMGNARATSEELELLSDTIDLRVDDDLLQHAYAWGASRARANSSTQRIAADSISVRMPGQRLRELHAVGLSIAEGEPDTSRFRADTLDWLRGDTIVARFDSSAVSDSTGQPALRQLVAIGNARSWHHAAPADTSLRLPAINYVRGREIIVTMDDQAISRVTVEDQASGVYVEPRPASLRPAPPDTTASPASATPARPVSPRPPAR